MRSASPPGAPLDEVRERPGGRSARIRADVLEAARSELVTHGIDAGFTRRCVRHALAAERYS